MPEPQIPVITTAVRTPQGKQHGVFAETRSEDLSIPLIEEILSRTDLDPEAIDDLMWGCAQQRSDQDNNLARVIALLSSLGESVPGTTINRWCASSMQAIMSAADSIRAGQRTAIIAGGVENMTRVPMEGAVGDLHPRLADQYNIAELQMGMTAEKVAREYDISRAAMDEYALESHRRAATATDSGRFTDELVPITTDSETVTEDEGIRRDTSIDALSELSPVFRSDGVVTAGNSSQISDGAAATLITSRAFAEEHGLTVLATIEDHHVVGVDPTVMGIGPVPATAELLDRTGQSIDDFDLFELNEAFASQTLYAHRTLDIPHDRLNVNGGAIAIGHPLGASGARLPVTLVHEMNRQHATRGLATLCVGFGQGATITFEAT